MMKHGPMVLALMGGLAVSVFAADPTPGGWQELSPAELTGITGGDLMLAVNRDKQMMTVTRITPGNYDNIQCFSVKVTTSVVRNKDVTPSNPKDAMENKNRELGSGKDTVLPKQFPSGTAKLSPTPGPSPLVEGLAIRSDATQMVTTTDGNLKPTGTKPDSGYNVHYVDPAKSTNTFGCVGVQSQDGMDRVLEAQRVDNSTYSDTSQAKQTITVSDYSSAPPPPPAPVTTAPKTNLRVAL